MKYTQPLPQHPGPMWPLPVVSRGLDAIVADIRGINDTVRADADEKIHALKVTAARLAEDLAEARQTALDQQQRADLAEAAGGDMVHAIADGIRREEELTAALEAAEADRDEARRERNIAKANARISAEITAAMSRDLEAKHLELRRVTEKYLKVNEAVVQLRTELDDAITQLATGKRFRLRRGR